MREKYRKLILAGGDLTMMYLALIAALLIRGGSAMFATAWRDHLAYYSLLHLVWLAVLYIDDFYSLARLRFNTAFVQGLIRVLLLSALAGVVFFYVIGAFGLTPKTILLLEVTGFGLLFSGWRWLAGRLLRTPGWRRAVFFLEADRHDRELAAALAENPYAPYQTAGVYGQAADGAAGDPAAGWPIDEMRGLADTVVIGEPAWRDLPAAVYDLALNGVRVIDSLSFWEEQHRRTPLHASDRGQFLAGFRHSRKADYEIVKRLADLTLAAAMGVLALPVMAVVTVGVKLSSPGPALYSQERLGRFGRPFRLYKFRSMRTDAEKDGPRWSQADDPRATRFGRFIRRRHLDELPQLWNIIRGEMSFVGPRPERPEFVAELRERLPYYSLRHLVRPGLSGWAQINYQYGSSVEDAAHKLAYDLWYIKNRGAAIDLRIFLKTMAEALKGKGQ